MQTELNAHMELTDSLRADWDDLAERRGAGPFLRPGWFRAWSETYGDGRVEYHSLYRDGLLGAIVVLRRTGRVTASATNAESPEFDFLFDDEDALHTLCTGMIATRPDRLSLTRVKSDAPSLQVLRSVARSHRFRMTERVVQTSPFLDIRGSWEEFEGGLSRNLRQSTRRKRKKLEQLGAAEVQIHDGRESLDDLLAEGFRVESSGWKAQGGTAIASDPRAERFYSDIARWASAEGWLRLAFLRLDGRAVAFRLDLEVHNVLYHLKGGFDPDFARVSPGNLLTAAVLEDAFARGLDRHEFLGAAEQHKLLWTDRCHDRIKVDLFAPSLRGFVQWASEAGAKPLARRLRGRFGTAP